MCIMKVECSLNTDGEDNRKGNCDRNHKRRKFGRINVCGNVVGCVKVVIIIE